MSCSTSRTAWLAASLRDELDHFQRLFRAHAGKRLVEQQELRLGSQTHGDLELALLAVAQRQCELAGAIRQTDGFERAASLDHDRLRRTSASRSQLSGSGRARLGRKAAVFQRAESRKDIGLLVSCGRCPGASVVPAASRRSRRRETRSCRSLLADRRTAD